MKISKPQLWNRRTRVTKCHPNFCWRIWKKSVKFNPKGRTDLFRILLKWILKVAWEPLKSSVKPKIEFLHNFVGWFSSHFHTQRKVDSLDKKALIKKFRWQKLEKRKWFSFWGRKEKRNQASFVGKSWKTFCFWDMKDLYYFATKLLLNF